MTEQEIIARMIERTPNTWPRERRSKGVVWYLAKVQKPDFYVLPADSSGRHLSPNAPQFIRMPDPKPRAECRILRKERTSPLTTIARLWENKGIFKPYDPSRTFGRNKG